jgi:hypothetical protein
MRRPACFFVRRIMYRAVELPEPFIVKIDNAHTRNSCTGTLYGMLMDKYKDFRHYLLWQVRVGLCM